MTQITQAFGDELNTLREVRTCPRRALQSLLFFSVLYCSWNTLLIKLSFVYMYDRRTLWRVPSWSCWLTPWTRRDTSTEWWRRSSGSQKNPNRLQVSLRCQIKRMNKKKKKKKKRKENSSEYVNQRPDQAHAPMCLKKGAQRVFS